jgi:putative mRNA 3-end processing factor
MQAPDKPLINISATGLFCEPGSFHIDPWGPADTAVVTHAHADHARPGSRRYLAAESCVPLLRRRLGDDIRVEGLAWGEERQLGAATISLHPAGHILGSAQVRVSAGEDVWVVTGDFKRDPDPTCEPFQPVACDVMITEATFALPIYRWPSPSAVAEQILQWWRANADQGRASLLLCYSLGKAQRVLAELAGLTDRPVYAHGAVLAINAIYRDAGVSMLEAIPVPEQAEPGDFRGALIIAPPAAGRSAWTRRFGPLSTGFCSGWMRVRGNRRRRGYDRGFVLSDHADWPALIETIEDAGPRRVLTTHGQDAQLVRFLRERGLEADALETAFGDHGGDAP